MSKTEQLLAKGKPFKGGAALQALGLKSGGVKAPGFTAPKQSAVQQAVQSVQSVTGTAPSNNTMTIPLQSGAAMAGPNFSSQVIPQDPNLEDAAPMPVGSQPNYLIPAAAIAAAGALYFAGILTPKAAALAAGGSAAAYALYLRTR